MRLVGLVSWPYLRRHPLRTLLTTGGIALGVAVFVAMHTANQAVLAGFGRTIERIAGKTELQITAGEAGFGEEVLERVQSAASVRVAVPVIEAIVEPALPGQGTLLVLGIDMTGDRSLREYDLAAADDEIVADPLVFLAQPDSLIISSELAARIGARVGTRIPLRTAEGEKAFVVRGIMKPSGLAGAFGGQLAIMDVYAAQKMFGRGRTFDRIDLAAKPGVAVEACGRELRAMLGPGYEVQSPASRGRQAETMLEGYAAMIRLSSAFALFVGMFIVYSSFSIAVTQRRAEIGTLRALGATAGQVQRVFLAESATLGVLGAIAGAALGVIGGQAATGAVGKLASGLYGVAQQGTEAVAAPAVLWIAIAAGVGTSLLGAFLPSRAAARVDPVEALQRGVHQVATAAENRIRAWAAAAAGLVALASLGATTRPAFYGGYALAIAAAVLMVPVLAAALARLLRPALMWVRPVEGALAADSLMQSPRRTWATVLALMLAVAMVVAFGGMARASYDSVVGWLNASLNPDLFVMPSPRLDVRTTRFPSDMAADIAAIPGVARVQMFRNTRITLRDLPAMAVAIEMASVAQTSTARPVAGDAAEMYRRAAAGDGFILSDTLSQRLDVRLGETLQIAAPYGELALPVVGIIVDYTDQQGAVFMDRAVFTRYWRDESVSDFRVYLVPGTAAADARRRILDRFAGTRQVFVLTSEEARAYVLGVADEWFRIMDVQVAVAVLVALLGIVNTLTVSIADRRRELGVLTAVGALRRQLRLTIWIEALATASVGVALGAALGALNLYFILDIVQRDVAGLRLDYQYPFATVLALVPIILAAAFAAAIWPAEAALRTPLPEALGYE